MASSDTKFLIVNPTTRERLVLVGEHAEKVFEEEYEKRGFKQVGEKVSVDEDVRPIDSAKANEMISRSVRRRAEKNRDEQSDGKSEGKSGAGKQSGTGGKEGS